MAKRLDSISRNFIAHFGRRVASLREERDWTLESCEERGIVNWRHLQEVEQGEKKRESFDDCSVGQDV